MIKIKADYSPLEAVSPAAEEAAQGAAVWPAADIDDDVTDGHAAALPAATTTGDIDGKLTDLADRNTAGDHAAARLIAAELRRLCSDDPVALVHVADGWLIAGSPGDAIKDAERALVLNPDLAAGWFVLGIARNNLGQRGAAIVALDEACAREPDNRFFRAMHASIDARSDTAWQAGFARLIALNAEDSGDTYVRDLLIRVYLAHATRGWTEVEAEESGGGVLVKGALKVMRILRGADVPPGFYATTAAQVKTAVDCLDRVKALGGVTDPEIIGSTAALVAAVETANGRRYNATWGETGVSILALGAGAMTIGTVPFQGLILLASGAAMLTAGFEPQYRTNRIALSKRGATIGDSVVALAQGHKWGGLIYLGVLIFFFPFVSAWKLWQNWGESWLSRSEVADLGAANAPPASSPELDYSGQESAKLPFADETEPRAQPIAAPAAPIPTEVFGPADPPSDDEAELASILITEPESGPFATAADTVTEEREEPGETAYVALNVAAPHLQVAERETPQFATPVGSNLRRPPAIAVAIAAAAAVALVGAGAWMVTRGASKASDSPAAAKLAVARSSPVSQAPLPPPVSGSPQVVNTGTLAFGQTTVRLTGIAGEGGIAARQMDSFISEQGGAVVCEAVSSGAYRCRTRQGYDIAAAALVNGAARIAPDAPQEYREMQAQAQGAHRGIWQ